MAGLIESVSNQFTPEKQAQAKKAWQIGRNLIYKENVFDSIMQEMANKPDQALAEAIVMVLRKIDTDMGRMPIDVALATGLMLLNDLEDAINEINKKTGNPELADEQVEQALEFGVQMYLQSYGEDNDKEQLMQGMETIQQAQQQPQQPQQPQQGV